MSKSKALASKWMMQSLVVNPSMLVNDFLMIFLQSKCLKIAQKVSIFEPKFIKFFFLKNKTFWHDSAFFRFFQAKHESSIRLFLIAFEERHVNKIRPMRFASQISKHFKCSSADKFAQAEKSMTPSSFFCLFAKTTVCYCQKVLKSALFSMSP